MSAGITAIALFTPVIASNAVFSARRASKGIDEMDKNPLFGIANMDIAVAQVVKGGRAAKAIAMATDNSFAEVAQSASDKIKKVSDSNKLVKGFGKVVNTTANYINPVIIGTGALKVAGSDDKWDAAARETLALGTMFGVEKATKVFVGMPITEKDASGKSVVKKQDGLYKKLFKEKQIKAAKDFCETKKFMKYVPGGVKGLLFVGGSIGGYKLGEEIANAILGEEKQRA